MEKKINNLRRSKEEKIKEALAKKPSHHSFNQRIKATEIKKMIKDNSPDVVKDEKTSKSKKRTIVNQRKKNLIRRAGNRPLKELLIDAEPRPSSISLHSILKDVVTVELPEQGSFNAGIAPMPNTNNYICVYRPNEFRFTACILDKNFSNPTKFFPFQFTNCADPRLIWVENKLYMIYSSIDKVGISRECIRGGVIMDLEKSNNFIHPQLFRVSPTSLTDRQKNWMPFLYENKIHLVSSVCPHVIYELEEDGKEAVKKYETNWIHPWFNQEFLRGNTNIVKLEDGNYMGTFHTVQVRGKMHYYDNGCYIFEGKPPFKVISCSDKTYMKAEDAIHPHYRKRGLIQVNFPVGMIRENENLFISYGDNDSIVKIMRTKVEEMKNLTVRVYNV